MRTIRRMLAVAMLVLAPGVAAIADDSENRLESPRVITGRVTDADDDPLAGAVVEWGYFSDGPEEREFVETDVDGRYRIETANFGRDYRIGASHPGFDSAYNDSIVPGPAGEPAEYDFQLSPGSSIELRITTPAGNPVPGLEVSPRTPSNGFFSSFSSPVPATPLPGQDRITTTDDDGRVTLVDLPARPKELRNATLPDGTRNTWNWLSVKLHLGEEWVHEFQITEEQAIGDEPIAVQLPGYRVPGYDERQDGTIRGRVVDKETGEPVTEFQFTQRHRSEALVVESSDGRFTYGEKLRNGREYQTRIFAPGYAVAIVRITADSPGKAVEQMIELERHPSLEGRLVDASTGDPLSDVQIVAGVAKDNGFNYIEWVNLDSYADGHHGLENVIRVTTDVDGRFTVPEEPDRPVSLVILTPEYERTIVPHWKREELDDDGLLPVSLRPAASATAIALRETQLGGQANALAIMFQSDEGFEHMYHSTELDEDGRLHFDSLAPGEYHFSLYLSLRGTSYPCYTKVFTLEAGEHQDILLGDMPGTLRIHGKADPFVMVSVRPTFPAEITGFAVQADVDGNYEVLDLFPGEYDVRVDNYRASSGYHIDGPAQTVQLSEDLELMLGSRPVIQILQEASEQ